MSWKFVETFPEPNLNIEELCQIFANQTIYDLSKFISTNIIIPSTESSTESTPVFR